MDYEKLYKDALERAKKQRADYQKELDKTDKNSQLAGLLRAGISAIDMTFPELAESEDERIRKRIYSIIYHNDALLDKDELLAWLEKQKDSVSNAKYIEDVANAFEDGRRKGEQKEQKPSSTKFRPGDWVVYDGPLGHAILQVKDVVGGRYSFVDNVSTLLEEDSDEFLRPLTPKDVEKPAEWSEEDEEMYARVVRRYTDYEGIIMRTKEESVADKILNAMAQEEIWLKSLLERFNLQPKPEVECDNETEIQKAYREGKNAGRKEVFDHPEEYGLQPRRMYDYETGKRNPEWSEEDEKRVKQLIYDTEAIRAGYEKRKESLGDDFNDELIKDCDEQIKWLKSLRPSWKPSEEQIEALRETIDFAPESFKLKCTLQTLLEDLKNL